jgi:hypothetical protein
MKGVLIQISMEVVVACFKVLTQYSPGETRKRKVAIKSTGIPNKFLPNTGSERYTNFVEG